MKEMFESKLKISELKCQFSDSKLKCPFLDSIKKKLNSNINSENPK
jgi:hypothetical protein